MSSDADWNSPAYTAAEAAHYHAVGWWSQATLSDAVRRNAQQFPPGMPTWIISVQA